MPRFLVESYLPAGNPGALRAAQQEHLQIGGFGRARCIRSIFLPDDELCMTVYEAPSLSELTFALAAAHIDYLRAAGAVEIDEDTPASA